jgi:hypothetical protein
MSPAIWVKVGALWEASALVDDDHTTVCMLHAMDAPGSRYIGVPRWTAGEPERNVMEVQRGVGGVLRNANEPNADASLLNSGARTHHREVRRFSGGDGDVPRSVAHDVASVRAPFARVGARFSPTKPLFSVAGMPSRGATMSLAPARDVSAEREISSALSELSHGRGDTRRGVQ